MDEVRYRRIGVETRFANGELLERMSKALRTSGSAQAEVSAISQNLGVTRFSQGRIHQNVHEEEIRVWARVWSDGGMGHASSTDVSEDGLDEMVREAAAWSKDVAGPRIELPGLVATSTEAYVEATANCGPAERAALFARIVDAVGDDLEVHGNIRIADQTVAIVNSAGLAASYEASYAALNLVVQGWGRSTGYGGVIGRDIRVLDFEAAGRRAAEVARAGQRPVVAPPGNYEVLLHPAAVSMLLVSLGYVGINSFGAAAVRSGESFLAGEPGRRVGSDQFTLVDDPTDRSALYAPFDAEGIARKPLKIIDQGVVVGPAHDLTSAATDRVETTGHALAPGDKGPAPHALAIPAGVTPVDDIVAGMKRGLIVHRIHPFVSLRGGPEAELSGTTRDGVFLVEKGEVVGPVANVRWTNRMTEVFRNVEGASKERRVEFMDLPEFSPHTNHVPSVYSTAFTVHGSQPREQ